MSACACSMALAFGRRDRHDAVVVDVDLRAGLLLDRADRLATGADDVADLVRLDLHRDDARRVDRDLVARRADRRVHLLEDVDATALGLLERLLEDLAGQAVDLDVHLQRADAAARTGDLEVHVAEVILVAEDVGEDDVVIAFLHQAHRDARDRRLRRNAGVHQRERAAAHRGHRRASRCDSRMSDDDADRVREVLVDRDDRLDRALGEEAVADLAARLAAQRLHLARRERREVVVHVERLLRVAEQRVELLLVVLGAERDGDERLGLATGEQRRAVRARQHAGLDADRADLVGVAAVDALARRQRVTARPLLLELARTPRRRPWSCRPTADPRRSARARISRWSADVASRRCVLVLDRASPRARRSQRELLDLRGERLVGDRRRERALLLAVARRAGAPAARSAAGRPACANRSASMTTSSCSSFISPSTIMIASLLAATMMSMSLFSRSANVGFATNSPSMRPTRTPASGPAHTRSEMCSAADARGHREDVGRRSPCRTRSRWR